MRAFAALALGIVATFASACGKDSSSSSNTASLALDGTWASGCSKGVKVILTIASLRKDETIAIYADDSCTSQVAAAHSVTTLEIGDAVPNLENTYALNKTVVTDELKWIGSDSVAQANKTPEYGYTDWADGVFKDISGKKETATSTYTEPAIGGVEYDIIKESADGTQLNNGDTATGDGTSEAKRPTAINTSITYTKQ